MRARFYKAAFVILCLICFSAPSEAKKNKEFDLGIAKPVDQGAQDSDFFVFRRNLINALIKRDDNFIRAIILPEIKFTFGTPAGLEEFYKQWNLGDRHSTFYPTLLEALLNGGEFTQTYDESGMQQFCAPYAFTHEKANFDTVFVTDKDVPVYDKPGGKIIFTASYNILKTRNTTTPAANWQSVYTPDGEEGYIATNAVRSGLGYRACFIKKNGAYKMNIFIAGD